MENFKDINFSNPENIKEYISISEVLGLIQEPFDQLGVAQKTYDKHFNNPESQYYKMTIEQICKAWSDKGAESCRYGSMLDDYIGLNLNNKVDEKEMFELDYDRYNDERLNGLCSAFDSFTNEILKTHPNLEYVTREQTVWHYIPELDAYIKGRFDALFYNKDNGHYVIVDWKSSGEIAKSNKWSKLLGPMKNYDACNGITYSLQVYNYKTTLEQNGYLPEGAIVDCMIVQFAWDHILENGKYYCTYNPIIPYDLDMMNKLYTFAIKKNRIIKRNEAKG